MAEGEFDYIVTGAGSAGCVVAARLSENGRHRVLLLEAGPPDTNPWIHIPLGFARTYVNPKVNWKFETAPQPQLNNRQLYLPRGKTLGGSSSINGMVYIRGNHGDYDEWRQRGCDGWDWDSVLPYFKKAENQTRGADDFHGVGGPLHVSDQPSRFELAEAALEACVQAGIPRNPDFNGKVQEGCGYYQTTTNNRRRWSTARAYLEPAKQRSNLVIQTGAHATRVLIENNRAVGVEYHTAQGRQTARCRGEVIVSGGAYGSPQLLLL
ncbi:MAG: GMC family oxidoreductase, partial [Acetobacteraceae bacterium]